MNLEEIKHILEVSIEAEEDSQDSDRYTLGMIHGLSFALELIKGDNEEFIRQVREEMK